MRSLKGSKRLNKKALIIVAHPDDESFFIGGTIAEFRKWRWTVLCVTDCDERYNSRRRQELLGVCRIYNRHGSHIKLLMLGVVKKKGRFLSREIAKRIKGIIDELGPFDIIFTHNDKGEYSHKTHKLVHRLVKKMRFPRVYNFYLPYEKSISKKRFRCLDTVSLSPASRRVKRQALNLYLRGSQKTNLSRLKRLVTHALSTKSEFFYC